MELESIMHVDMFSFLKKRTKLYVFDYACIKSNSHYKFMVIAGEFTAFKLLNVTKVTKPFL